jgi:hypothetical protein
MASRTGSMSPAAQFTLPKARLAAAGDPVIPSALSLRDAAAGPRGPRAVPAPSRGETS